MTSHTPRWLLGMMMLFCALASCDDVSQTPSGGEVEAPPTTGSLTSSQPDARPSADGTKASSSPISSRSTSSGGPYQRYARQILANPPKELNLLNDEGRVGNLSGGWTVIQVLDADSVLVQRVDRYSLPSGPMVLINGKNGIADGQKFRFPKESLFLHRGTYSYTTVLGAPAAAYQLEYLDPAVLGPILAKERSAKAAAVAAEGRRLAERLRPLEAEHLVVQNELDELRRGAAASHLSAVERLEMYASYQDEPGPGQEAYRKTAALIDTLDVSDEDIFRYRKRLEELKREEERLLTEMSRVQRE